MITYFCEVAFKSNEVDFCEISAIVPFEVHVNAVYSIESRNPDMENELMQLLSSIT
jgi:D-ribose pyranose/furanose isomerase RbsD